QANDDRRLVGGMVLNRASDDFYIIGAAMPGLAPQAAGPAKARPNHQHLSSRRATSPVRPSLGLDHAQRCGAAIDPNYVENPMHSCSMREMSSDPVVVRSIIFQHASQLGLVVVALRAIRRKLRSPRQDANIHEGEALMA